MNTNVESFSDERASDVDTETNEFKKNSPTTLKDEPFATCFNEMWNEFLRTTTMHGVSRTRRRQGQSVIRSYLWAIIVLGMVGSLIYIISHLWMEYFQYNTVVKIKVQNSDSLPFPAVTICNLSPYNKSAMNYTPALQNLFLMTGPLAHTADPIDWTDPDYLDFTKPRRQADFEAASFHMNRTLLICLFERQKFDCSGMFHKRITNTGLCYTFNASESTFYTGSNNGLVVVLTVNQVNNIMSFNLAAGIKVVLHNPDETPDMENDGFLASPGFSTYAAISYKKYIYLPKPYVAFKDKYCIDTQSPNFVNPLRYFAKYTHFTCMFECRLDVIVQKCNCRLSTDPGNATICSFKDSLECYAPLMYNFDVNIELQKACACDHPCEKVEYTTKLSSAFYPNQETGKFLSRYNLTNLRDNMIELRIYYDALSMKNYVHTPEYTFSKVIGTLGGQFGLFIGASLLTISEFAELFVAILFVYLKQLVKVIKVKPTSQ